MCLCECRVLGGRRGRATRRFEAGQDFLGGERGRWKGDGEGEADGRWRVSKMGSGEWYRAVLSQFMRASGLEESDSERREGGGRAGEKALTSCRVLC